MAITKCRERNHAKTRLAILLTIMLILLRWASGVSRW